MNNKEKKIYYLGNDGIAKIQLYPIRIYADNDEIIEFYRIPEEYENSIYLMYSSMTNNLIFISKKLYLEIIENDSVYSFVDYIVDKRNRSRNRANDTQVISSGQIPMNSRHYSLIMSMIHSSIDSKNFSPSKKIENNIFYMDVGHKVYTVLSYKNCIKPMLYVTKKFFE